MFHLDSTRDQLTDISVIAADDVGRVVDHHLLDAATRRFIEQDVQLGRVQMAAGQDDVGFGDQVDHLLDLIGEPAVGIEGRERNRVEHLLRGFWKALGLSAGLLGDVVCRRQRRHPDDLAAKLDGMIDGMRVDAAGGVVERNAGEKPDIAFRKQLLEQDRVRHAGIEVILVEHGTEFRRCSIEQFLVMIENARHRRRTAMAVQIDRADQKFGDFGRPRQRREPARCLDRLFVYRP